MNPSERAASSLRRVLAGLFLFGISFGYVEAAVVVYLRTIQEPLVQQLAPGRPKGELFPLADPGRLAASPATAKLLRIELAREAATIVMLASVAIPVAVANRAAWLPSFAVVFGVWDIFYYVFLKVLVDWPASLLTWDLLFLIPVPWVGPVLAPVLISLALIGCGVAALWKPVSFEWMHWAVLSLGCVIMLYTLTADWRQMVAGGIPQSFPWGVFLLGELVAVGAFAFGTRLRAS